MNRRPVNCENSDDIRLDTYLKNISSTALEKKDFSNNCREDPCPTSSSRRVNGVIGPNRHKFLISSNEITSRTRNSEAKSGSNLNSQSLEEEMDQPINVAGQYRHFPPADEAGGDSSDILNSSSIGDDQLSRRRFLSSNSNANNIPASRDSDIDNEAPEIDDDDDGHDVSSNVNEISSLYHMRRQQRRQQQRLRRRDTSSASVCGDTTSRRRPPISLSRSSTRIVQSSIPPPPSEPPPSLPPCGIDLNTQYSMYPVLGAGGFNLVNQQTSVTQPAMLHITGLPINYMPSGGLINPADTNHQILQMQQAAMFQQQQQQQQRIASLNAAAALGASGNPYLQGFATVGRPVRTNSLNQPQMTLPSHHQPLQDLELISSTALLQAHVAAQAQANATQSAGGSGSVVYENSYNSFQRLPPGGRLMGQLLSTISQDLLPASAGGATNGEDNQNSTSSTTNGAGAGVSGPTESLVKSPSVVAMVSANSPSALVTTPLMNFYDASATSGGGNTYINHPQTGTQPPRNGSKSGVGVSGATSDHISRPFWRCSWQYWVILICVLAFLLAVSFAVFFSENAKWLENRLHEKYAQDPAIFGEGVCIDLPLGLFDPHHPPQTIEASMPVKIRLEPMGLWAGHWITQSELCTIYNITLTSELSSIGVFLRYSTMPTIVHYNHFDRILGRELKADAVVKKEGGDLPKEAFPSLSSASHIKQNAARTTGRVRCLKKGHWFISLVNDQPRAEDIVFSLAELAMARGCPNDCSNRGVCSQGVCECLNGLSGKDCSTVEDAPICSGHGEYRHGKCHCFAEWKGAECETLWSECPDPTCSEHGHCVTGECLCFPGYGGDACQFRTCPSHNCSNNGICIEGFCRCFAGWGGEACDRRESPELSAGGPDLGNQLQQKDTGGTSPAPESVCSFNGYRDLSTGDCRCFPGFEGATCEKDVTCAGRCVQGVCKGDRRQLLSGGPSLPGFLPSATALTDPAICFCNDGWRGVNCDVPTCDAKCLLNGQCINDTCVCNRGWTGTNCNLNECPLGCSSQGQCVQGEDGHYFCQCFANRKGSACQVPRETSCNDGKDDDQDGLIDCLDPDCCGTEHCDKLIRLRGNQQQVVEDARQSCAHSNEINALILSTKLAPPGSSFYDKLEFLLLRDLTTDKVDPSSYLSYIAIFTQGKLVIKVSQMCDNGNKHLSNIWYIALSSMSSSRVSVVRGVVRQWDSTPFWGCRVFDRLNPVIGSALTDKNGRFELVVDGGFLVQLEFIRHPTSRFTAQLDIYVPVNQIVNIGDFYLTDRSVPVPAPVTSTSLYEGAVTGFGGLLPASPIFGDLWIAGLLPSINSGSTLNSCPTDVHDISRLGGPVIKPNRGSIGDSPECDTNTIICFDSDESICANREGVLFHRYPLKPSSLHLVHNSDKAGNSPSYLEVSILAKDRAPPDQLNEVHLSIDVAGLRQSWRFEPVQGLEFTFVWNRTDGYNRSVYGRVPAKVSVGFLYGDCTTVFWEHLVVYIDGHDITPTDLAEWNLDARQTFAPNQGIVYMGDGRRVSVQEENLQVKLILGKPNVRRLANRCEMCLGRARENPILRVAALATDETGRLLVGDGHFLRYLETESHHRASGGSESYSNSYDDPSVSSFGSGSWGSSSNPDWLVADVRPMSFVNGGAGEDDWPEYFIARHPISSEELEALSRGGIGGGRAGIFLADTRNRTIWWTSLARRDFIQMVISEQCPNDTTSDCLRMPLANPKGLVVTYNEDLFFIDEKRLWRYQLRGPSNGRSSRIELVIGHSDGNAIPMPCDRSLPAKKVRLTAPSFIAYNPVEDCIYYVDDKRVFRLHLASRMVSLAAGHLPGCKSHTSSTPKPTSSSFGVFSETSKSPFAIDVEFSEIRGIGFSSLGELYIAESDVLWIRRCDGRLYLFAGARSATTGKSRLLHPFKRPSSYSQVTLLTEHPALDFHFGNVTSITVGIFDEVFVADAGHNAVFVVRPSPPQLADNGRYFIQRKALETLVFDKQGRMEGVIDALTRHRFSSFSFSGNGWLSSARIRASEISLKRSSLGFPQQVILNTGETYNLTSAPMNRGFGSIASPFGGLFRYEYSKGGQLSKIWTSYSSLPYVASYSPVNGILKTIYLPSGWSYSLQKWGDVKRGDGIFEITRPREISMTSAQNCEVIKLTYSGGAQEVLFERLELPSSPLEVAENHASWQIGRRIQMYVQPQSSGHLLSTKGFSPSAVNKSAQGPRLIENLVMSSFDIFGINNQDLGIVEASVRQRRLSGISGSLSSSLFLGRGRRDLTSENTIQKTRKTLSINGQPILSVTLDRESRTETFRSPVSDRLLLQITYNLNMQPTTFATEPLVAPPHSGFVDMSTVFNASTSRTSTQDPVLAPLRIVYTREGQLKEAFWGASNYRLSYDSRRRLRTAEIGSTLNTLVFDYQSPILHHQPTEVSVSGVGTYRLVYKKNALTGESGLSHIITPLGFYRTFSLFTSLGVERLTLVPWALEAGSPNVAAFIFDWETRIKPSPTSVGYPLARFTWPSGRRVNRLWEKRLIIYDNVQIQWDREELTDSTFVSLKDAINEFEVFERRHFGAGTLVTHVRGEINLAGTRRPDAEHGRLLGYSYEYEYDHSFVVSGIRSCLFQSASFSPLWCHRSHMTFNSWAGYSINSLGVSFFREGLSTALVWNEGGLRLNRRFDSSGRLLAVSLHQESKRQEAIINATFMYAGGSLLPSDMDLETTEDVPVHTHYRRGPGGRVEGIDHEIVGSSRRSHLQVVYNEESRISDLRQYISDSQFAKAGNSESKHVSTKFLYERGLVSSFGKWRYVFDEDSCLVERRLQDSRNVEDLFEYDSKGLLRWVERRVTPSVTEEGQWRQNQRIISDENFCNGLENACYPQEMGLLMDYAVQFLYDFEDRLVVARNTLAIDDMVQFFYAHPQHRNRLTSFFHHGRGKAYFLTYEQETGHLYAIEEVGLSAAEDLNLTRKMYVVITDTEGSPIALYGDEKILWTAEYSATGGRRLLNRGFTTTPISDDFIVPLGYRGALMDPHTGFLFHTPTWQAYDPLGATLTSPDWRRAVTSRLKRLHSQPQALDLHTVFSENSALDPLTRLQQAVRSPAWWLRGLDRGIDRFFPHLQTETGVISSPFMEREYNYLPMKCSQGVVTTSRRLQQAKRMNDQLERLGIVHATRVTSNTPLSTWFDETCPKLKIKTIPPVFGDDVSFSLSPDGTVSILPSEKNISLLRIAEVLFSGAKLMDSWYLPTPSHGGLGAVISFVQLFVKVPPTLNTDIQKLQLQRSALLSQIPINLGGTVSPLSGVMVSLDNSAGAELRISSAASPGVQWRLRYEDNWTVASGRVLQEARRRGVEGAKRRAVLKVSGRIRGPRTSPKSWPPWPSSSSQMRQMESDGVVKGYVWKPVIREPKRAAVLTELLDDPSIYQLRPGDEKTISVEN